MKIVKLGEVVDFFNGSTPLKTNKNYWANGDVPWFTIDDLRKQGKYITYTEKSITKLGLKESSISLIPENAVLLCCTASVGAIAINKIRLTTNQQFNALVVKNSDQLLVEYLYYWFLTNMDTLKSLGRATTIDYVSMSKLRDMALQLPSLEKQREIVEKLDLAFAEIDLLEENLALNSEYMVKIEASLVANLWIKYASQLTIKNLDEVADYKNGSAHEKIVDENGKYIIVNSKFISSNGLKFKRSSKQLSPLKEGDVAMVLSDVPNGKALAKCFLVDKSNTYTLNQRICKLTSESLLPEYLALNINRNPYLLSFNNGENQTNLRLNDVLKTPIYFSDKITQKLIIDEFVEAKNTIVGYLTMNSRKLESVISLRQSLLSSILSNQESDVA